MSKAFHVTQRARKDLHGIWRRVAEQNGVRVADRIISEIYDAIQMLATFPGAGHTREDVKNPRYRFWSVYRFVIAYRIDRSPLTVSRVLHGAQDFKAVFR